MIVNNINPYQGMQNAIRPGGSNTYSVDTNSIASNDRAPQVSAAAADNGDRQLLAITERINTLHRNLDLTLVYFPPFFPIASYQRMDLITEMQAIGGDISQADISPALKQAAVAVQQLSSESTDADLSDALDKLTAVRDTLVNQRAATQTDVRPGSLLALEI